MGLVVLAVPLRVVPLAACTDIAVILLVDDTYHLPFILTDSIIALAGISDVSKQ